MRNLRMSCITILTSIIRKYKDFITFQNFSTFIFWEIENKEVEKTIRILSFKSFQTLWWILLWPIGLYLVRRGLLLPAKYSCITLLFQYLKIYLISHIWFTKTSKMVIFHKHFLVFQQTIILYLYISAHGTHCNGKNYPVHLFSQIRGHLTVPEFIGSSKHLAKNTEILKNVLWCLDYCVKVF